MPLQLPNRPHQVYSLWLIPDNPAFEKLQNTISDLSVIHGAPGFEPHLTLLSSLQGDTDTLMERTRQLAEHILPLSIRLHKIEQQEIYFKCLFLEADVTPELSAAFEAAKTLFKKENAPEFHPHLSLIYGIEGQESIASKLDETLFMEFEIKKITLMSTKGEVDQWKEVLTVGVSE